MNETTSARLSKENHKGLAEIAAQTGHDLRWLLDLAAVRLIEDVAKRGIVAVLPVTAKERRQ